MGCKPTPAAGSAEHEDPDSRVEFSHLSLSPERGGLLGPAPPGAMESGSGAAGGFEQSRR